MTEWLSTYFVEVKLQIKPGSHFSIQSDPSFNWLHSQKIWLKRLTVASLNWDPLLQFFWHCFGTPLKHKCYEPGLLFCLLLDFLFLDGVRCYYCDLSILYDGSNWVFLFNHHRCFFFFFPPILAFSFFFFSFFNVDDFFFFESLLNFVKIVFLFSCFGFLAARHVGS